MDGNLRDLIGCDRSEIPTPSLVLDRPALVANITAMAGWARGRVAIRPHTKTHKCVEIGRLQLEHGAIGLTTATVAEADAMLAAGPDEILIANEVTGEAKLHALTGIARRCRLIVAVDDPGNAAELSAAAVAAGVTIHVVVDVDLGMRRCGVRSIPEAVAVARSAASLPGLEPAGITGFEGHTVLIPDPAERAAAATGALGLLEACATELRSSGCPVEIVSAGGTNTYDVAGVHPAVTELQAGTYATMDQGYRRFVDLFRPTLTVAATVISRSADTAVLDCGTKTVSVDVTPPSLPDGLGRIREVHEEHTLVDPEPGRLTLGTRVEVRVGYAGGTINLHDAYVVVEDGAVCDVWAVCARGAGTRPPVAEGKVDR